ncbi:hypothetical protein IQ07DRAFT_642871 [Pyrenochaeta sp. DS3sAY3a]|nr:hypothetical protein IQ07DRAFT_642871 [Pyrenochaeta sp. DS3sAY3a]
MRQARELGRPAAISSRSEIRQLCRIALLSERRQGLPDLLLRDYSIATKSGPLNDRTINKYLKIHCGDDVKELRPNADYFSIELSEIAIRVLKDNVDHAYIEHKLEEMKNRHGEDSRDNLQLSQLPRSRYSESEFKYFQRSQTERDKSIKSASKSLRCLPRRIHPPRTPSDFVPEVKWSWTHWIGVRREGESPTDHLEKMHRKMMEEEINTEHDITILDCDGNSLLHAFISLIDACSMEASRVQEILEIILRRSGDLTYLRNARGETPLHLAVRRALPHVVAPLLQHICWRGYELYDNGRNFPDLEPSREQIERLGWAIHVCNDQGVTLFTDLHFVYWLWRISDEEAAMHYEIDALLCIRIIVDALVGRLPAQDHKFRSLRWSHNLPQLGKEADGTGPRPREEKESMDHDQDSQETPPKKIRFRLICAMPEGTFRELATIPLDWRARHASGSRERRLAMSEHFDNGRRGGYYNGSQSQLDRHIGQEPSGRGPYNDSFREQPFFYYDASHSIQTNAEIPGYSPHFGLHSRHQYGYDSSHGYTSLMSHEQRQYFQRL